MALLETIIKMFEKEIKKNKKLSNVLLFLITFVVISFLLATLFGIWLFFVYAFENSGLSNSKIIATLIMIVVGIIAFVLKKK